MGGIGTDPMMVEEESGDSPGACSTVCYSGKDSDAPTLQPRVVVAQGFARRWSVDIPRHVQTSQCLGGRDCAPAHTVRGSAELWHVCGSEITYPSGTDTPSHAVYGRYWD